MFFSIDSFALFGIEAVKINVEINISNGLPVFSIVGLPDKSINEAKDRVRASIINSGFKFPQKKIIINLSPADIKKEGSCYDLPIALCVLFLSGQIRSGILNRASFIGELSLNGVLNPVRGVLAMSEKAKAMDKEYFFIPFANFNEASIISGIKVVPCKDLLQCISLLGSERKIPDYFNKMLKEKANKKSTDVSQPQGQNGDFKEINGQLRAKRAMEIAVSGFHNILLIGPPGSGKSMLAKRSPGIMPELGFKESIEVTKIHDIYKKNIEKMIVKRPFRNPHHSTTLAGMIGGGSGIRPGEISLANRGILFLDEFSEFSTRIIEALRQPLEDRNILISRNGYAFRLPCFFMLIIAMNPCYCGFYKDKEIKCRCTAREIARYWKKISGPLLDRIDLQVNMPREQVKNVTETTSDSSALIKNRIKTVYKTQFARNKTSGFEFNSQAQTNVFSQWIKKESLKKMVLSYAKKLNLSSRQISSLIRVSRTIADMEGHNEITEKHILEALQYKIMLSKTYFPDQV